MKTILFSISLFMIVTLFLACGPSKQEQVAREKAIMDSVAKVTRENVLRQEFIKDSIIRARACEPSKQEQVAREKTIMDSVAKVTRENVLRQEFIKDSIIRARASHTEYQKLLRAQIIDLKAKLAGEQTKLQSIKEWQFMRTPEEKQHQVEAQSRVIEEIKQKIADIEKKIE